MNQPATTAITWVGVALVAVILVAAAIMFGEGQDAAASSLVTLAVGLVVGGGGIHLTK